MASDILMDVKRRQVDILQPVANRGERCPITDPPPLPDDEFEQRMRANLAELVAEQQRERREFEAHIKQVAARLARRLVDMGVKVTR